MPTKLTLCLSLFCALLLGAVARDLVVDRARAADDVITRADVSAAVRALETQARATQDLVREVRDAARACK